MLEVVLMLPEVSKNVSYVQIPRDDRSYIICC